MALPPLRFNPTFSATVAGVLAPAAVGTMSTRSWVDGQAISPIDLRQFFTSTVGAFTNAPSTFTLDPTSAPLPSGVTLVDGVIDGTPSGTAALGTLVFRAANGAGHITQSFGAQVFAAGAGPTFSVAPAITGDPRVLNTMTLRRGTATGSGAITWNVELWRGAAMILDVTALEAAATTTTRVNVDADAGLALKLVVSATDATGTTIIESSPVTVSAPGVPEQLPSGVWVLFDSISDGADKVGIQFGSVRTDANYPGSRPDWLEHYRNGAGIVRFEYQLNSGAGYGAAIDTGSTSSIQLMLQTVLAATPVSVQVRMVNTLGNGPWSTAKTITPTAHEELTPIAFVAGDFAVYASGRTGEALLHVKSLPTANYAYEYLEARIAGSTIVRVASGVGVSALTGFTNGVSTNVEIRTINRNGNVSAWSPVKTVTTSVISGTVYTPANYAAAIAAAADGAIIRLAAGDYRANGDANGRLNLSSLSHTNPVIIEASNPADKPQFSGVALDACSGFIIRDMDFHLVPTATTSGGASLNSFSATVNNISFIDTEFHAGIAINPSVGQELYLGYPFGLGGFMPRGLEKLFFSRCAFYDLGLAISGTPTGLTYDRCTFDTASRDYVQLLQPVCMVFDGCTFGPHEPNLASTEHVDFWQSQMSLFAPGGLPNRITKHIMLARCTMHAGSIDKSIQGILPGNEAWDVQGPGAYLSVIENTVYIGHTNAIGAAFSNWSHVRNNLCMRNLAVFEGDFNTVNDPKIIFGTSVNGFYDKNIAHGFSAADAARNVVVSDNITALTYALPDSTFGYNTLFETDSGTGAAYVMAGNTPLANIKAKAGSVIYTNSYGPASIRP